MGKKLETGICPDCGEEALITSSGLCRCCRKRKNNAIRKGREYKPYIKLSKEEKNLIDKMKEGHKNGKMKSPPRKKVNPEELLKEVTAPEIISNYYQIKTELNPKIAVSQDAQQTLTKNTLEPISDTNTIITTLNENGCEIPKEILSDILKVLLATDKLKDMIMTIVDNKNQEALLNLEQSLNVVERKLQHVWEFNGFQIEDDKKFKEFLIWRRTLKSAIFFWKKLYSSNTLLEMQRAWNAYTQDPSEKVTLNTDKDRIESKMKRYQITTETISTILNTRKDFTRVIYATSEELAHDIFVKWLSDRQLHENKAKTKIVELSNLGEQST